MMGETVHTAPEKWRHFRPAHPVGISVVDCGPLPAVIAESQVVGRHKVAPEARRTGDACKHRYVFFFFLNTPALIYRFCFVSHSLRESRPCVMTPVNSVSRRASNSNQWILSSVFAHHAPPLMSSSSSEPWEPHRPQHRQL